MISIVANIAQFYGRALPDESVTDDLALQLELGIPEESLEVARTAGSRLTRGDYRNLLEQGLTSWQLIQDAIEERLAVEVGSPKAALLRELAVDAMSQPSGGSAEKAPDAGT